MRRRWKGLIGCEACGMWLRQLGNALSHQNQNQDACEERVPEWLSENRINLQAPEAKQSEVFARKLKKCESRSRFSSASKPVMSGRDFFQRKDHHVYPSRAHSVDPFRLLFLCLLFFPISNTLQGLRTQAHTQTIWFCHLLALSLHFPPDNEDNN